MRFLHSDILFLIAFIFHYEIKVLTNDADTLIVIHEYSRHLPIAKAKVEVGVSSVSTLLISGCLTPVELTH